MPPDPPIAAIIASVMHTWVVIIYVGTGLKYTTSYIDDVTVTS